MANSILRYFEVREDTNQKHPMLPVATTAGEKLANKAVQKELKKDRKRRGEYYVYDDEIRAKVGRYAVENGNRATVEKYSAMLGHPVSESTVRSLKKRYLVELERVNDPDLVKTLPRRAGRPPKLGKYDDDVKKYVTSLRLAGGIVNRSIVLAAAKGILEGSNPSCLAENGGDISLDAPWAQSFLQRLGYSRRKGTKAAKTVPSDFEAVKAAYLDRIRVASTIENDQLIPPELVINFDQTNTKFIPVSEWTLVNEEGSKQVSISGKEDKRDMTVLLSCTLSGKLLSPQLIYAGRTNRCHPNFTFPSSWNVTHSINHWSTEDTLIEFLDEVIIPYVNSTRRHLELPDNFPAVVIFDIFATHQCPQSVIDRFDSNDIKPVFVPAGHTGELQPLRVTVNEFKRELKSCFTVWYAEKVSKALKNSEDVEAIKVNLAISVIKPLHSMWLVHAVNKICKNEGLIQTGFEKTGITSLF